MNTDDVKKAAWSGALSNYGRTILRIVLGLITFRMLYQGLSRDDFGFWSLLWSVFGYGILLDFGFGYAAQKRVAEGLAKRDWDRLSRALSTIFFFYLAAASLIALAGWALADPLMHWLGVAPDKINLYRPVTILFFAGMALGFPLGIFPEVLRGLQQLKTANRIAMIGLVANAVLLALALHFNWGLFAVFAIALACVLGPDILAGFAALRAMPEVRLRPSLFSRSELFSTGKFSLFAWLNMISNLLRNKTDQVVAGALVGLPAVTLYQAGGKAGEMFGIITKQISDALSPAAAFLHAGGTIIKRELRGEKLLVDTGCLVALTPGIQYDIERVGGLKSMVFGGEGLFLASLQGHGTVWLQSLPFSRLADRILASAPSRGGASVGEGSVLGGLGRLLDGK